MDVTEIHIYGDDGDGPDGGEPLVVDLNNVELSTGKVLHVAWDERGIITFDA